jgi:uncharacterized OsmC-like protein
MDEKEFSTFMEMVDNYEFRVKFDPGMADLTMDEPSPLGKDKGPNASRILSAAIGNCLSASLLFCLQKARVEVKGLKTRITTTVARNEKGRFRIPRSRVEITVDIGAEAPNRVGQCLKLFEDFCIVTQSVRNGITVGVEVKNQNGEELYRSP